MAWKTTIKARSRSLYLEKSLRCVAIRPSLNFPEWDQGVLTATGTGDQRSRVRKAFGERGKSPRHCGMAAPHRQALASVCRLKIGRAHV